jgi:hypothetical protein
MKKKIIMAGAVILYAITFSLAQNVTLLYNNYEGNKSTMRPVKTAAFKKIKTTGTLEKPILQISQAEEIQEKIILQKAMVENLEDIGEVSDNPNKSPLPSKIFEPVISQKIDPHIAVGRNYIIITNYDDIGFFDKSGTPLQAKGNGLLTRINADDFFETFFDPINEIMEFDNKGAEYQINEFYDLRVIYDDNCRRFFIVAAARNQLWINNDKTPDYLEPFSKRLVAFAVSKTEDPRDGFHQYMTVENNYRDWPRIAVSGNHLLIANNAADGMGNGPVIYVVSINDIKTGKPKPAAAKYGSNELYGIKNVNVISVLDKGFGFSCFFSCSGDNLTILYFQNNDPLAFKPLVKKVTFKLNSTIGFISNGALIRNNNLYFTYQYQQTAATNTVPARFKIRYIKLPLIPEGTNFLVDLFGTGLLQTGFGRNTPEDDPEDLVSYEEPEIAINQKGDFLIGYGRTPVKTKNTLFPEVRYTVFYHNETTHRRSTLLKKGESIPKWVHNGETTARYGPHSDFLHYSSATVDPADDSFWMIHVYAEKNGSYRVVAGNIKI